MFLKLVIAIIGIFCLLMGWLVVQSLSRLYARKHPEFGPAKEEGQGCGHSCNCTNGEACNNK